MTTIFAVVAIGNYAEKKEGKKCGTTEEKSCITRRESPFCPEGVPWQVLGSMVCIVIICVKFIP